MTILDIFKVRELFAKNQLERLVHIQFNEFILKEEISLRQKSRMKLAMEFLHKVANGRNHKSFTKELEPYNCMFVKNFASIEVEIIEFYKKIKVEYT